MTWKSVAQFALQTYPGPSTASDIAVLQPNSSGGYDHVATLGGAYEQSSLHISGRRVVAVMQGRGCAGLRSSAVVHANHGDFARFRKRYPRLDRARRPVRGGDPRRHTRVPPVEPRGRRGRRELRGSQGDVDHGRRAPDRVRWNGALGGAHGALHRREQLLLPDHPQQQHRLDTQEGERCDHRSADVLPTRWSSGKTIACRSKWWATG